MNQLIYNFHIKRKSQIYSILTVLLPIILILSHPATFDYSHLIVMLILVVLFAIYFPKFISLIIKIEDLINLKLALLTPSRMLRILFHVPIIIGVCLLFVLFGNDLNIGITDAIIILGAANGLHGIAETLCYKNIGNRTGNILIAFAASTSLTAICLKHQDFIYLSMFFLVVYIAYLCIGLLSDIRSKFHPKQGIGIFFGTFNPVHKTHLKILEQAINDRNLEKIYIHATTIPKLHRDALKNGEIILLYENGMRTYKKTSIADTAKNYFPTGNKFYEYELRRELLKAGVEDAGLINKVEILDLPETYEAGGFSGVLSYIKSNLSCGRPIHGIHGSDTGGIWVRNIFDSFGWIYPYPVKRSDNISATSIRNGATGLTSPTIEAFLKASRNGDNFKFPSGYIFKIIETGK